MGFLVCRFESYRLKVSDLWILYFFEFITTLIVSASRFIYCDYAKKIEPRLFIEDIFVGELNGVEWIVVQCFIGIGKPERELVLAFVCIGWDTQLNIER